jgi:hypothetical protein
LRATPSAAQRSPVDAIAVAARVRSVIPSHVVPQTPVLELSARRVCVTIPVEVINCSKGPGLEFKLMYRLCARQLVLAALERLYFIAKR